jgi:hypothetical protein
MMRRGLVLLAVVGLWLAQATPAGAQWYAAEACTPYRGLYGELSGDSAALCARTAGYGNSWYGGQAASSYLNGAYWNAPLTRQQSYYTPWSGSYSYCMTWWC